MKLVIYCRYSCELQNPKSLQDQEREVRAGLARLGIGTEGAEVIADAASSGTSTNRAGFDSILTRIKNGEPLLLAVDDQSRFNRMANALSLITDLVFAGGRFLSICEQIDSAQEQSTITGMKIHQRQLEKYFRKDRLVQSLTLSEL